MIKFRFLESLELKSLELLYRNKKTALYKRIEKDLLLVRQVLAMETNATNSMLNTYYDYSLGKASKKEMELANQQFQSLLKAFGLGFLIFLPFSILTIPFLVKLGKKFNIDILPHSFQKRKSGQTGLSEPPRL
jgi:hypothetical protein